MKNFARGDSVRPGFYDREVKQTQQSGKKIDFYKVLNCWSQKNCQFPAKMGFFVSLNFLEGDASKVTPSKYIKSMMMTTEQVNKTTFWVKIGIFESKSVYMVQNRHF